MRPAGSCYVCEGCGSTSGCSWNWAVLHQIQHAGLAWVIRG